MWRARVHCHRQGGATLSPTAPLGTSIEDPLQQVQGHQSGARGAPFCLLDGKSILDLIRDLYEEDASPLLTVVDDRTALINL